MLSSYSPHLSIFFRFFAIYYAYPRILKKWQAVGRLVAYVDIGILSPRGFAIRAA